MITLGYFLHREEKVSSKKFKVLLKDYRVLKKCTAPKCFEKCAQGQCCRYRGAAIWELRGRAVWERLQETFVGSGCLQELQLHFSFSPHPWSLPELSAALPTPAHTFHWFWIPDGLGTAPFPCLGPQSPVQLLLPPLGSRMGLWLPALFFTPAPCPGSAVARPFLPVVKALLLWKGSHDSCIKNLKTDFIPFLTNSQSKLREKAYF